jgi:hypothetical protein
MTATLSPFNNTFFFLYFIKGFLSLVKFGPTNPGADFFFFFLALKML